MPSIRLISYFDADAAFSRQQMEDYRHNALYTNALQTCGILNRVREIRRIRFKIQPARQRHNVHRSDQYPTVVTL